MTNEEKILSMLEKIQSDVDAIKTAVVEKVQPTPKEQLAVVENLAAELTAEEKENRKKKQIDFINGLANLLTDEEKDELGRYWDAEQRIKEKVLNYKNQLWQEEMKNWERQDKIEDVKQTEARYA